MSRRRAGGLRRELLQSVGRGELALYRRDRRRVRSSEGMSAAAWRTQRVASFERNAGRVEASHGTVDLVATTWRSPSTRRGPASSLPTISSSRSRSGPAGVAPHSLVQASRGARWAPCTIWRHGSLNVNGSIRGGFGSFGIARTTDPTYASSPTPIAAADADRCERQADREPRCRAGSATTGSSSPAVVGVQQLLRNLMSAATLRTDRLCSCPPRVW